MRRLSKNIAAALIMTMSLSMLPAQFQPVEASAAQTKKVAVKKTEITVSTNKAIKNALKKKSIKRIILKAASAKRLSVPKGNYKTKTLVINLAEKSKIHIAKGAKFKKIILIGTVRNAGLIIDESGNKLELSSKANLTISGKASYAELTLKPGAELAKITSKIELIAINKTKKTVKLAIAGSTIAVKAGDTYASSNLNIEEDETAQGAANIGKTEEGSKTGENGNTAGGETTPSGIFFGGNAYVVGGDVSNAGNTSNNGSSSNTGNKAEAVKLVNEARTKIIDATSFQRFVVVNFEKGYTKDNTTVYVDGVDITSELTPVDKEGTIVKWEVSNLNPAEVKVVSKADNKLSQTVKLNRDADAGKVVAPVLTTEAKSPKYIIGYGKVAVWDYYLSNYDDEGKLRYKPKTTTFDLNLAATRKVTEKPYYTVPAVEEGNVEVQFNYTDEADKIWFDRIPATGALQLVSDNENQTTLNKELVYTKSFKEHHGKTVAVLSVSTNQSNFRSRGYYRIRIKSADSKAILVRVKVEGKETPEFLLKEPSVQSGKNLHFAVKNVVVGLENPVEKVELILPTGEIKTLRYISDYFMFNDLFVLYNDVTRGKEEDGSKGVNNIPYNGNYTLRVHFNSYKTIDKVFRVTDGKDIDKKGNNTTAGNKVVVLGAKSSMLSVDGMKFDAVAGASKISTGSDGSPASGGKSVSANIIFNTDLVANAEIFEKLGIDNAYAKGIVDRFEKDMTNYIAVYDEEGKVFYNWEYYNDAVNTARTKGKYLTFSEYVKTPNVKTTGRLTRVKEVLEDNLLGELVMDGSYLGKSIEGFTYPSGSAVRVDEELVVYADKTYLSKIIAMYPGEYKNYHYGTKNPAYALKDDEYRIDGDKLIIKGSAFITNKYYPNYGKNTITVYADGYQPQTIEATVSKAEVKPVEPKQPETPNKPETPDKGGQTESGLKSLVRTKGNLHMGGDDGELTIGSGFAVKDAGEWIKSITAITVDGVKYSNVGELDYRNKVKENQYGFTWGMLKLRRPNNSKKEVALVIESSIYKSYTITFNNSSPYSADIISMEETKNAQNTEPAFTEAKYNGAYNVYEIFINPKREDLLKSTAVKMFVKGSDGTYKEVVNESIKVKTGIVKITDYNNKYYPTALGNLLVEGENEVKFEFDGVSEPVNVVLIRSGKYYFSLSLKK